MQPSNISPTEHRIVREYTSSRAFHKEASELYARTGYTVADTAGMTYHGLVGALLSLWPHQEHLVITYESPTNPSVPNAGI